MATLLETVWANPSEDVVADIATQLEHGWLLLSGSFKGQEADIVEQVND
jgi:hypothetical protein